MSTVEWYMQPSLILLLRKIEKSRNSNPWGRRLGGRKRVGQGEEEGGRKYSP